VLTGGERHDMPGFDDVFAQLPAAPELEDAVMDKGYDSHHIREIFKENGLNPVIPPKSHRTEVIA
jgi:Transposase DDE domain